MKYERLNNHIYVLVNLLTAELCKQRAKPTFSHPKQTNFPLSTHTNYNSFYKWTKLLTIEITIFGLKIMVKNGLEKVILTFHITLQSCCCPVQQNLP